MTSIPADDLASEPDSGITRALVAAGARRPIGAAAVAPRLAIHAYASATLDTGVFVLEYLRGIRERDAQARPGEPRLAGEAEMIELAGRRVTGVSFHAPGCADPCVDEVYVYTRGTAVYLIGTDDRRTAEAVLAQLP